jgi:hypothetical protein
VGEVGARRAVARALAARGLVLPPEQWARVSQRIIDAVTHEPIGSVDLQEEDVEAYAAAAEELGFYLERQEESWQR